jgi:hypothetical protein
LGFYTQSAARMTRPTRKEREKAALRYAQQEAARNEERKAARAKLRQERAAAALSRCEQLAVALRTGGGR